MLERIESLSLPGDPNMPNEDAFGTIDGAAVVIDGATNLGDALMPGGNDAAWLARFGARRLMAHAGEDKSARKTLRDALADTEKSFLALRRAKPEAMWQMPSASMMLVVEKEDALEFLSYGDCAALLMLPDESVTVIGTTFESRDAEADRARQAPGDPAGGLRRPEVMAMLRASRNRINDGHNWRFSPDVRAAAHAARRLVRAPPGSLLLLASDGFTALATDYGAYDAVRLMEAAQDVGLEMLGAELRAIEHNDPRGTQFPRFKKSDDATALLLRVT